MDVAPTVLELFGLPAPAHMDGRVPAGQAASGRAGVAKTGTERK